MKAIRTKKIKITGTLKADYVIKNYIQAINWLSCIVFKTHELNSNRLQRAYYPTLREKFNLPSQIACNVCKHITMTYQAAKSNKRWKPAVFKNTTVPLVWKRDFNRGRKGVTLWGEPLKLSHPDVPYSSPWKDSKLKKMNNKLYLLLCYEIEVPELKTQGCIVGVDSGIKRMLVASNSSNNVPFFFHGGKLNHLRQCIRLRRASIQTVGTRSSRRLLQRLSRKEAVITEHLTHVASKALARYSENVGARVVVFEELSNVQKSSCNKRKEFREKIHHWPYRSLQFKAGYKLVEKGIATELINPAYTSQTCPRCGHIAKGNRIGLYFKCLACGHKGDADLTASENIRNRYVAREQNSSAMGIVNALESSEFGVGKLNMVVHENVLPD